MEGQQDQVAIVTGGGSGIGQALCAELARRGRRVVVADLDRTKADAVVRDSTAAGGVAESFQLDVADQEQVAALIEHTVERHGRLDLLVNNAGVAVAGQIDDIDLDRWRQVVDINLTSQIAGCYHGYRVMRRQGWGQIANVASGLGLVPSAPATPYVTTKYGSVGLTLSLRPEAAVHGVRVNAICPGFVRTPIFGSAQADGENDQLQQRMQRFRRWSSTPDDAARRYLKGLARDRAVITESGLIRTLWWLHRLSPALVEAANRHDMRRTLAG